MVGHEWHTLGGDGSLHIKTDFGPDSYDIWATDLCSLWHENLSRKQILCRAGDSDLRVDLEDLNNLRIVLEHLASTLQTDEIAVDKSREGICLELDARVKLPKPLEEFSWNFKLAKCTCNEFKTHVTAPLFETIQLQVQGELDLVQRIKDKDHVIERLLESVVKGGIDLATVFPVLAPHASARKALSQDEAKKIIPALATFNFETWRNSTQKGENYWRHELAHSKLNPAAGSSGELETTISISTTSSHSRTASQEDIGRNDGGQRASPAPALEYWGLPESAVPFQSSTLAPAVPVSKMRKTIGGGKPSPPSAATIETREEVPVSKIRRTIGGRKSSPPAVAVEETRSGQTWDERAIPQPKPPGIKRTIGGRKTKTDSFEPTMQAGDGSDPSISDEIGTIVSAANVADDLHKSTEDDVLNIEAPAREIRKAPRREVGQKPASRAKKRKF